MENLINIWKIYRNEILTILETRSPVEGLHNINFGNLLSKIQIIDLEFLKFKFPIELVDHKIYYNGLLGIKKNYSPIKSSSKITKSTCIFYINDFINYSEEEFIKLCIERVKDIIADELKKITTKLVFFMGEIKLIYYSSINKENFIYIGENEIKFWPLPFSSIIVERYLPY